MCCQTASVTSSEIAPPSAAQYPRQSARQGCASSARAARTSNVSDIDLISLHLGSISANSEGVIA
jgi:hypothetical protein